MTPERFLHDRDSAAMEGRCLGGYQIVREIGEGGMGSVYLAARVDGVVQKSVAIKLMKPGLHDPDLLNRFYQEREILASLDHPAIARFIDGGSTEEGQPYFIMEYVDGRRIDRWCDERKLNLTERLKLFRKVCAAVQYAHQKLVIHRDLKPANILVTADGNVKLLDFGIGKLMEPRSSTGFMQATVTLIQPMTPAYASPEQVKGEAITTLLDVYSLGVVLYELLTGRLPYRLDNRQPHEIARIICEEEPVRPSTIIRTSDDSSDHAVSAVREGNPIRLQRRLEGDLDSILLMALRKEPARRYGSVEQFNEDLRRHLDHLPVIARPDTLRYRIGKLIRRQPGLVVAATLIVLSIITGLATMMWAVQIAFEEHREAQELQSKLRQQQSRIEPRPGVSAPERPWNEPQSPPQVWRPAVALYNYAIIVLLILAIYITRAIAIRVAAALAGGVVFSLILFCGYRIASAEGWWNLGFPVAVHLQAVMFTPLIWYGAIANLVAWRITRRFGWRGEALFILIVTILAGIRGRAVASFTQWLVIAPGLTPLLAETLTWAAGLLLGLLTMRIIAGAADSDRLARTV